MLRHLISNELYTILIITSLVLITIAKLLFEKRFADFIYVIGNSKYLKIYARDQKFFDVFDGLLFFNLILNVSIFAFISLPKITEVVNFSNILLLKFTFAIGVFLLIKTLIERLIASVFDIDILVDRYLFQKISYNNFLGLILLPINILLLFSLNITSPLIYAIISLFFLINLIGLVTSFNIHQNTLKSNLFYFILYLCALEISPYIILYKVFIDN